MSKFDPEKLKALQASKGAKVGTQRIAKPSAGKVSTTEDVKVTLAVGKLGGRVIPNVTEVNFFHSDSTITQFAKPKFLGAMTSNTYCISGKSENKHLLEAMATNQGLFAHMGMEGLQNLQKMLPASMMGGEETEDAPELVDA